MDGTDPASVRPTRQKFCFFSARPAAPAVNGSAVNCFLNWVSSAEEQGSRSPTNYSLFENTIIAIAYFVCYNGFTV